MSIPICPDLNPLQNRLENHPVFSALTNLDHLAIFMQSHVFAVWDFMCLVKRLQRDLTSTQVLWLPPKMPLAARLINDIVLAEETDEAPDGSCQSHFSLYLQAMHEIGAKTNQVDAFIDLIRSGETANAAMQAVSMPDYVKAFVKSTLDVVEHGSIYQVLGHFVFGREHVIPMLFQRLLNDWKLDEKDAPMFVYYLKRHIELDGDEHGPAAFQMIRDLTANNPAALQELCQAAASAIEQRLLLWDGVALALSTRKH